MAGLGWVLLAWLALSTAGGLLLGAVVRRADRHAPEPAPGRTGWRE